MTNSITTAEAKTYLTEVGILAVRNALDSQSIWEGIEEDTMIQYEDGPDTLTDADIAEVMTEVKEYFTSVMANT